MNSAIAILFALVAAMAGINLSAAASPDRLRLVVLGDSLVAGYNLPQQDAFPAVLQKALIERGHKVDVANAGVSGDTSTGGLARLDWALGEGADAVILELGANDMLRGIPPDATEKALDGILAKLAARKIPVLIAGMVAAPGMGREYEDRFKAIYPRLAKKYGMLLYPFFLDGVAANRELLLADGMHPNARGVDRMVRNILPDVERLLAQIKG